MSWAARTGDEAREEGRLRILEFVSLVGDAR